MMDSQTNISELKEIVKQFCDEREWDQYHNPKDLAIGIITEASELLEHFRFKSEDDIEEMLANTQKKDEIGEELADVLYFLLIFSHKYDFDLSSELIRKMKINEEKYPIKNAKGSNKKYSEL